MTSAAARKTIPARRQTAAQAEPLPPARRIFHDHGLSIVLFTLFLIALGGQMWAGWYAYNSDQRDHGSPPVSFTEYLSTGHFGEATFENWESEFLQMAFYVVLTIWLYQKGSSESKRPDVIELVDLDPRTSPMKDKAPWPVRQSGLVLTLYENSLSLIFGLLFITSLTLHATTGVVEYNEERMAHGDPPVTAMAYVQSSRFWFESLQNWQSEFLALGAMVTFSIFFRQRGSPESKPVDAPIWETAD